ncbi:MAG: DUF4279 domain-containing protein [Planctomycetes bacterium]|nr:DUF4279 domain-containing protein [Planctomycetota bacterium]
MDPYFSVWARVVVESPTLSPSDVTKLLGIEPSVSVERVTPRSPSSRPLRKTNIWVLESPRLPPGSDPTPLVNDLLTRIGDACISLMGKARRRAKCRLQVFFGLTRKDSRPELDSDTVRRAAAQGLRVMQCRTYPYAGSKPPE